MNWSFVDEYNLTSCLCKCLELALDAGFEGNIGLGIMAIPERLEFNIDFPSQLSMYLFLIGK